MSTAILSLGSNLGDRAGYLSDAVAGFGTAVTAESSMYRTPPWGPVPQPDYYNLILRVSEAGVDGREWLARCHAAESAAGRERLERWGPRTLDADVVAVWDDTGEPVISDDPVLTLPHPRAAERGFVLIPWAELDPDADLPGSGRVASLIAALLPDDVAAIQRVVS